jgi:hypothetical protein
MSTPAAPSASDIGFGLLDAFSGVGLGFMTFLACIPGLLPAVVLTVLLLLPLVIPFVVLGAAGGLLFGLVRLAAWAIARTRSLVGARWMLSRRTTPARRVAL